MKTNILRISILPLVLLLALSLTRLQPQKDSRGKGNEHGQGNNGHGKGNSSSRGNQGQGQGRSERADRGDGNDRADNGNGSRGNNGRQNNGNKEGHDKKHDFDDKGAGRNDKIGKGMEKGKFRSESIRWNRDENILWGFENYSSRKRPKDFKKVTVCHNTGNNDYPVTISISENALKAHLNHGDQVGNCTISYSDRWPADYIRTRENVYNTYENTWETMSYSEALLRFAADKLLGIKSTFQTQRPTLSQQEIERRELLIMELQNNINSLENQLAVTRQRTDGINININL